MRNKSYFFIPVFFLLACGSNEKDDNDPEKKLPFASEKILVERNFPEYEDQVVKKVMEEIGLCLNSSDTLLADSMKIPLCRHDWFRVFLNRQENTWKNGFLIEVKEGIYSHTPQVINVVFENGKYKVTNSYKGELLEMRTTPGGCFDLIIRYIDSAVGTVAILHVWEKNQYAPVIVTEINDHFVKEEYLDSLNKLYIEDFAWGY